MEGRSTGTHGGTSSWFGGEDAINRNNKNEQEESMKTRTHTETIHV